MSRERAPERLRRGPALTTSIYYRLIGIITALNVDEGLTFLHELARPHTRQQGHALNRMTGMDLLFYVLLSISVVSTPLSAANRIEWPSSTKRARPGPSSARSSPP